MKENDEVDSKSRLKRLDSFTRRYECISCGKRFSFGKEGQVICPRCGKDRVWASWRTAGRS